MPPWPCRSHLPAELDGLVKPGSPTPPVVAEQGSFHSDLAPCAPSLPRRRSSVARRGPGEAEGETFCWAGHRERIPVEQVARRIVIFFACTLAILFAWGLVTGV